MDSTRRKYALIGSGVGLLLVVALLAAGSLLWPRVGQAPIPSIAPGGSSTGDCLAGYEDLCGPNYEVSRTNVDSATGQSAFVVVVSDGTSRARVEEIAKGFAARHAGIPTVVYVVPQAARWENVHFDEIPNPLTSSTMQRVSDPKYPNWVLTYIAVPSTAPLLRWGPGAQGLAGHGPVAPAVVIAA